MKFKRIISIFVTTVIVGSTTFFAVSAVTIQNKQIDVSNMLDNLISDDVYDYASNRLLPLVKTLENDYEDFRITINNVNNISLGKPYVIYNSLSCEEQDNIYYFPVIEDNIIKCILSISVDENTYNASLSEDIAVGLNNINYVCDNNYIFYRDKGNIYAENSKHEIKKLNVGITNDYINSDEKNLKSFTNLLFDKKVEQISNNYGKNSYKLEANDVSPFGNARGFSKLSPHNVRLNTKGCFVSQYFDGNCWAASVATTLRYLNYSKFKKLTARNVCDKVGIGYNEGGSIYDEQKALIEYGITDYNIFRFYPIEFKMIQKNILNQKPVLVGCNNLKSITSGHVVPIIGYSKYSNIKQVVFYNPVNMKCITSEYKTDGLIFSYGFKKFKWRESLSRY